MASEVLISPPFGRPRPDHRPRRRVSRPTAGAVASLPVWLRRFRVEVLLWAFRERRSIDAAALTAVLGAKHARADEPFGEWSRHTTRELLWVEVGRWCEQQGVALSDTTATTMWTLLDHLNAVDGFGPGSDPLSLLREPLLDSGGVNTRGVRRPSRHPSQRSTRSRA